MLDACCAVLSFWKHTDAIIKKLNLWCAVSPFWKYAEGIIKKFKAWCAILSFRKHTERIVKMLNVWCAVLPFWKRLAAFIHVSLIYFSFQCIIYFFLLIISFSSSVHWIRSTSIFKWTTTIAPLVRLMLNLPPTMMLSRQWIRYDFILIT